LLSYSEHVLALDECYPVIATYDERGWHADPPPRNADLTYLDASFYVVRVTAPAKLTVVASGSEVGRERVGGTQVWTYAAGPSRDFYIAASDRYVAVSETVGETTVHSYATRGRADGAELALGYAVAALRSYNARFGPYPYTELDVASTPMRAMGIEYPGIVGISLDLYDPRGERDGLPAQVYLESVVAHEVGHQWFYGVVGNDQIHEPWLDESLVQYVTWLYYLDTGGAGAARGFYEYWTSCWGRVDRAEVPIGLPAADYGGGQYVPIVYCRGPLFMQALEKVMGGTFDGFLRDYYASHKWGTGTGEAFRALAEEHCQCDLGALFKTWVDPR
jgi:aminopeptidase N